jgi:RES domain-containing protein
MTVWRLDSRRFAKASVTGGGAFRFGGRWNLPGTRVIYCAESRALAAMESMVHVEDFDDLTAVDWRATAISIPRGAIVCPPRFPQSWRTYPYTPATQQFGSDWVRSQASAALRVPSAVVPGEFNYLINPAHPDFAALKIASAKRFRFDFRLAR